MPSPDLTPYVNLTLFDRDPQEVFAAAMTDLGTKMVDWVPREGNTEVLLMESLAVEVAEAIFAVNRLPDGIAEVLLRLFGIDRDNGAVPTATIRFFAAGTQGYTVPAGTAVRLNLVGGLEPIVFVTQTDLVIPNGQSQGDIAALGDRFTSDANGTIVGTTVEILDSLPYINTATIITAPVSGGRDTETDAEWLTRGSQRFGRLVDTLVLPQHFVDFALEQTNVERALAVDNYNMTGVPGDSPGYLTLAVYGDGVALTSPEKAALAALIGPKKFGLLSVSVVDPHIEVVNVNVTVKALPTFLAADVEQNVEDALDAFLNPMTWDWDRVIRRNDLITVVTNTTGVDYVTTLTTPASDVTAASYVNLADLGTVSVTVT